ncbi:hypothetical protein JRO89_XS07G0215000 [Xanthoceras sorbifolium]|uniref:Glycosyltransferase n=1 Tax=Xanthoceras sorbifolium TaxID=99658 RepID=A0ABQ8HUT7_9ROSI|nr:hypothetical protein JRO89_XS07G0215000 [Xanthoceras sorbifolium]
MHYINVEIKCKILASLSLMQLPSRLLVTNCFSYYIQIGFELKCFVFSSNVSPVTCIISDGFLPFTIKAGEEIGVPTVLFFTISACSFMGCKQFRTLKEKGLTPLKDESHLTKEYLDTVVDWIPGMNNKNIRIRDLPSFVRTTNPDDLMFNLTMEATDQASKASFIVIHTFQALEIQVLDALSSMFSRQHVLPIGPLQLLLNKVHQEPEITSLGCNLWKPDSESIQWLDAQKPGSVIYVNFGSLVVLTKEQVVELGTGPVNSNHPFLWIIRSDLVTGNSGVLPAEFMAEIKRKGFVTSWCPQEEVLKHRAVGGFLSRCRWNSTMESLCAGVPMICWPFGGDQQTNCRYACTEWGFGVEVSGEYDDGYVKRNEIEKVVRELMEGEKGHEMRNKAMDWKKMAEEATDTDDPSSINLEKLVSQLLSTRSQFTTL